MSSILPNLSYTDYDAIDGVRSGDLSRLAKSPLHYLTGDTTGDTASRAMLRAMHAAVLEPHTYAAQFAVCDVRRDARTAAYKDWLAAHPGVTALTQADADKVDAVALAISQHPVAGPLLAQRGQSELTMSWTDEQTGLPCKGRIDRLVDGATIVDLKGYGTTDTRVLARRVVAGGAHVQAAHYRAGLAACTGLAESSIRSLLVCYEVGPPWDVAVVELERDGALAAGEMERRRLLDLLAECHRTGTYPGRAPKLVPLDLPAWAWGDEINVIGEVDL